MLENKSIECQKEAKQLLNKQLEEQKIMENRKNELIYSLMTSPSFAMTHTIIRQLSPIQEWNDEQRELLCKATNNPQVDFVLMDDDVCAFFTKIVSETKANTPYIESVRKSLHLTSSNE